MVIAPASRSYGKMGLTKIGKIAGRLRACRGSSPFPGAKMIIRTILFFLFYTTPEYLLLTQQDECVRNFYLFVVVLFLLL